VTAISTPLLDAAGLSVRFLRGAQGRTVVEGPRISIASDKAVSLRGPSGSGKTSLAPALTGWLPPDSASGSIRGRGRELPGARDRDRRAVRGAGIDLAHTRLERDGLCRRALHPHFRAPFILTGSCGG
jgi:peptide/nickel transport system ATP-binding protein